MSVDRSEVDAVHQTYAGQLNDWKSKYEKAQHDLAEARRNADNFQVKVSSSYS